ncbi:MAG: hypothetical protein JXD22_00605 [Sedimentisphaerales bacterium]|nr:hypothetical protein [Sedimentisphaerales bacterium]
MFQRRLRIFAIVMGLGLGMLACRLIWLQVLEGEKYQLLSKAALELPGRQIETVRGTIYDSKGRVLALDRASFDVCLTYKLTRLYDERFWQYQELFWQKNPDKQQEQREKLLKQRSEADDLLEDLSELCSVSCEQLLESINEINDSIHVLQTARARRRHYENEKLQWRTMAGAAEILRDYAERVPDEDKRLWQLYQAENAVREMYEPQVILANISRDEALTIEERMVGGWFGSEGSNRLISIRLGKRRVFPYGRAGCHLIGQVRAVQAEETIKDDIQAEVAGLAEGAGEAERDKPDLQELLRYRLGERRGEWGVEYLFEQQLRGRRGWVKLDRHGQIVSEIERVIGSNVRLTIDIELQRRIARFFEGDNAQGKIYRGAAVVIDVVTGKVLAMVSVPTFDLSRYYLAEEFKRINFPGAGDVEKVKLNRALSEVYEPGSTIKPTLLFGLLEDGVVSFEWKYLCVPGNFNMLPRSVCYLYGHGEVDGRDALKRSCDFYFIELVSKMGYERFLNWLRQAGFGRRELAWPSGLSDSRIHIAFREAVGHMGPWDGSEPSVRDLQSMSVGLGTLDDSLLQIANSFCTIARDGVLMRPRLIDDFSIADQRQKLSVNAENIRWVREGMQAVVYERGGSGYKAFNPAPWPKETVQLYGKTGSTTHCSLFGGYGHVADGVTIALAVVVEDDGGGGTVAAPIARRIFEACGDEGYLPPVETRASFAEQE